jgi:hypothetical protein
MSFLQWIFTNFGHPFAPKILETGFSFNFLGDPCQGKCKRYRVSSMKIGSKCYRPGCFINNTSACTEIYLKRSFTLPIVYRLSEFQRGIANDEPPTEQKIKVINSLKDAKLHGLRICTKRLWQQEISVRQVLHFTSTYMKPLLNELSSKYTARRLRGHDLNIQSSKLI